MKLGILKTGAPPVGLERYGSYPAMFRKLLGEGAYDYAVFDAEAGQLPGGPDECSAYLVTGSARGAYEPLPWIAALKDFLCEASGRAALVGICFGHQVMAEAFGGRVIQSPKGWGLGLHRYEVRRPRPWLGDARTIALPASHQDQVVEVPPGAEIVAGSAFTPCGVLAYRDRPAMSMQLHPEFEADYAAALIEIRRGHGLTDEDAGQALASLRQPGDQDRAAGWISAFLRSVG